MDVFRYTKEEICYGTLQMLMQHNTLQVTESPSYKGKQLATARQTIKYMKMASISSRTTKLHPLQGTHSMVLSFFVSQENNGVHEKRLMRLVLTWLCPKTIEKIKCSEMASSLSAMFLTPRQPYRPITCIYCKNSSGLT